MKQMKRIRRMRRKKSLYPSSMFLQSICRDDYKDTLDRYSKIYDRTNIAIGFCGVILLPILTSFDYTLVFHLDSTVIFLSFALSLISILLVICALILLLLLMRSRKLRVFDSIPIRNRELYRHPEEESALWLIKAYTDATADLLNLITKKQKMLDSAVICLIVALLTYSVSIIFKKGI